MAFPRMCPARWLSDQNFEMCMPPHDFMYLFPEMQSNYYRPWMWYNQGSSQEFGSTIENEKGNYKITLDVKSFRSNEINVKVSDFEIIVEGRHEERPDTHGFVTRQFKRRYPLPNHCPTENVTSTLSSDGVLTIIAARKSSINETEKIVPIKICGASSRKTQVETKITSEIKQKTLKEDTKVTEDIVNKNISQLMLKENHSRLLKPDVLKENKSETNGTSMKMTDDRRRTEESVEVIKASEKIDPLNISGTSNKIEESIEKSILGLTALTEQLGQNSSASKPEKCDLKITSEIAGTSALEMSGMKNKSNLSSITSVIETSGVIGTSGLSTTKNASEMAETKTSVLSDIKSAEASDIKSLPEFSSTKNAAEMCGMKSIPEVSGKKSAIELSGIESALGISGTKIVSDSCGVMGMSKTLAKENASSYISSSSTFSSIGVSSNLGECISDIREELREAAENV